MKARRDGAHAPHDLQRIFPLAQRAGQRPRPFDPLGDQVGRVGDAASPEMRGDRPRHRQPGFVHAGQQPKFRERANAPRSQEKISVPAEQRGLAAPQVVTQKPLPVLADSSAGAASAGNGRPLLSLVPKAMLEPLGRHRSGDLRFV